MTYKFGIPSSPVGTVTDVGGTQSTDASTGVVFSVALNAIGTNTVENPTNLQEGQKYTWQLKQDAVTPVDVEFGDDFYFADGTAPTITQVAGAVDIVRADALDDGAGNIKLYSAFEANVKAVVSVFENDYSVLFDESLNQYAQAATNSEFDFDGSSPFSISMWIKPVTAVSSTMRNMLSKLLGAAGNWAGYNIYLLNGKLSFIFLNTYPSDQAQWTTNSTVGLSDNTWAHVVMVYTDKSTAAIYVDDSAQAATKTGTLSGSISVATKFTLGARPNDYPSSLMWDGNIDEISVWDKALSSGEVSTLFNGGIPTDLTGMTGLTNWYRMGDNASDDLTGTTGQITDVVGSNNLTPYNTTSANKVTDVP